MKKILVIDDDAALRTMLGRFLKAASYDVQFAADGMEGLELVKKAKPDLIIADVSMPNLDGITLCSMIKKDKETAHIRVLILTGKGTIGDAEDALKEGPDGYLTKPFEPARLLKKLESLLQN